ncbi:MAG: hypothetical protein ABH854_03520 [Candidatus Diapherotrites archaeon]|nr:hypothetical protein [Candidatus Micrarchaeota archaeon]MBU1939872.1 hypothetical protein [Candidatus Micrarchaeota archaeon]
MSHKSQEKKEFLSSARKKIGPGLTNAPVWVMQKKQSRIWNKKQKRHWRRTKLGLLFKKKQGEQGKLKRIKPGSKKKAGKRNGRS